MHDWKTHKPYEQICIHLGGGGAWWSIRNHDRNVFVGPIILLSKLTMNCNYILNIQCTTDFMYLGYDIPVLTEAHCTLTAAAMKTKPIGDYDDPQFTTIINSASMAALIGLPPKMAWFCHTSNRLLVGRWCCSALWGLYFYSSAVSWLVVGRSVHNKGTGLWEVSLQKDNSHYR